MKFRRKTPVGAFQFNGRDCRSDFPSWLADACDLDDWLAGSLMIWTNHPSNQWVFALRKSDGGVDEFHRGDYIVRGYNGLERVDAETFEREYEPDGRIETSPSFFEQFVQQLCSAGATRSEDNGERYPTGSEFVVDGQEVYVGSAVGSGDGYVGFVAMFEFDLCGDLEGVTLYE